MLALARAGLGEGVWLRAERQFVGRGRQGRDWVSPPGNLYASTLVRLRPTDSPPATLSLVVGVALHETIALYVCSREGADPDCAPAFAGAPGPQLKWPNDLLVNGAKLSGILLERGDDAVVVGIGVNVAHHPDLPDRPTTSLAANGVDLTPEELLDTLAETFARWLTRWRGEGLAPVRDRWLALAHPRGTALRASLPDGTTFDGLFDGLDADGALILRLADGDRRVIHAADLFSL